MPPKRCPEESRDGKELENETEVLLLFLLSDRRLSKEERLDEGEGIGLWFSCERLGCEIALNCDRVLA